MRSNSIHRAAWSNAAIYGALLLLCFNVWSAVEIYGLGLHDGKLGSPGDNFIFSAWLSLAVAGPGACGHLVALYALGGRFTGFSHGRRVGVAVLAAALVTGLAATGVLEGVIDALPLDVFAAIAAVFVVVGAVLAVVAVFVMKR